MKEILNKKENGVCFTWGGKGADNYITSPLCEHEGFVEYQVDGREGIKAITDDANVPVLVIKSLKTG